MFSQHKLTLSALKVSPFFSTGKLCLLFSFKRASLTTSGQDAAGIVTCGSGGRFYQVKANGMVRDVFDAQGIAGLKGWMGVGHGTSYDAVCVKPSLDTVSTPD